MKSVIGGRAYNTETATRIASDRYWDGSNLERNGRNEYLYKTKGGAYFTHNTSRWTGERDTITPLTKEEAIEAWERLPEKDIEFEEAFDTEVQEAAAPGRPPKLGQTMTAFQVYMTEAQREWVKAQPGGAGETIRALIDQAMQQ